MSGLIGSLWGRLTHQDASTSMEELRGLAAAIRRSQAVIEFSLDGIVLDANEHFLSAMGYRLDEIRGKHHSQFVEPAYRDSEAYSRFWQKLGRGESEAGQFKRVGKGGKEVWIQASYNPVVDGKGRPFKVVKFGMDITQQHELASKSALFNTALDSATANVMVADNDLNIIYMNEAARVLMTANQAEFRKDLPNFDASRLVGTNIDGFHKNPAHQRQMIAGLTKTFTSNLKLGGRTMRIIATPVVDAHGKRQGTIVEWADRTQEIALEQQAERNAAFRTALDNVTTNVMMADADLNIIYMNGAATSLMTSNQAEFRKDLPNFDASRLIGTNIDGFHKNPAHQRGMLAKLSSTFTSHMKIGGRSMRIIANPVIDAQGKRLGTVVEWADRTLELATEAEVQEIVAAVLDGDLQSRVSIEGKTGFFVNLATGINNLVDNMADVISKVKGAASEVHRGADEISQGNTDLSQRTEEQASSLEETASSMEQMTSTVKQNADNAGQANQLAMAARDQAEKGGQVVAKAVTAMTDINQASRKIADIIGVIDEIAFQTNLLALNAAVEAARAGEQGRGFAVVASEVRNLAGRSATAAKEIKGLIQDSVRKVEEGSVLVNQSGMTLEQIVSSVKKVTDIVAEIAAASQEQSAGIEQVNKAVMQLDELTQQNAALVEEASAASQSMAEQARSLNETMARYTVSGSEASPVQERRPAPSRPRIVGGSRTR